MSRTFAILTIEQFQSIFGCTPKEARCSLDNLFDECGDTLQGVIIQDDPLFLNKPWIRKVTVQCTRAVALRDLLQEPHQQIHEKQGDENFEFVNTSLQKTRPPKLRKAAVPPCVADIQAARASAVAAASVATLAATATAPAPPDEDPDATGSEEGMVEEVAGRNTLAMSMEAAAPKRRRANAKFKKPSAPASCSGGRDVGMDTLETGSVMSADKMSRAGQSVCGSLKGGPGAGTPEKLHQNVEDRELDSESIGQSLAM